MEPKKIVKKRVVNIDDELNINNEMANLDLKNYEFYNNLSDSDKKRFSPFLMLRWGSSVYGSTDIQSYYLMSINETLNKHYFDISKHPQLQWQLCAASSPGMGKQKHYWLTGPKKGTKNKFKNKLLELLPNTKEDDIDNILLLKSEEEIIIWLKEFGFDDKTISALKK